MSGDLISRSALGIGKCNPDVFEDKGYANGWNSAIEIIEAAPVVDAVEVVHGEWELKHIGAGHYWECSVCHTNPCIYVTKNTKFCPNCGARMDGDRNAAD